MPLGIKQHDRRPWMVAQLQHVDGSGIDVSSATRVDMIVRKQGSTAAPWRRVQCERITTHGAGIPTTYDDGTPVTNLDGWVRYKWATGDTDESGTYDVEWEILWAADDPQTVPTQGYYTMIVHDDLDGP